MKETVSRITCDACGTQVELSRGTSLPQGWVRIMSQQRNTSGTGKNFSPVSPVILTTKPGSHLGRSIHFPDDPHWCSATCLLEWLKQKLVPLLEQETVSIQLGIQDTSRGS